MILFFYRPNFYTKRVTSYYEYEECALKSITPINIEKSRFNGWLFKYKSNFFSKEENLVIFEKNNQLYIDFGKGCFNFYDKSFTFHQTKTQYKYIVDFFIDNQLVHTIKISIYEWQYWMHDGGFSEDICPINVALEKIALNPEGLINFFQLHKQSPNN